MAKKKLPATLKQQIAKLKERGCIINDEKYAEETLKYINYFRLSNYFQPFCVSKDRYEEGTTFENIMRVYEMDRKLRSILIAALEEIEIALRASISNYHALKYGALGYLNASSFDFHHNHHAFTSKIRHLVETNEDREFVRHYNKKHQGSFPLWVIMELFSFGMLNTFYADLKTDDKKAIADKAFGVSYRCVEDWLYCLSDLRNACAHYTRLYANKLDNEPKQPGDYHRPLTSSVYDHILILKRLYPRDDAWRSTFLMRLEMLIMEYSDVVELEHIGFPDDWREELE